MGRPKTRKQSKTSNSPNKSLDDSDTLLSSTQTSPSTNIQKQVENNLYAKLNALVTGTLTEQTANVASSEQTALGSQSESCLPTELVSKVMSLVAETMTTMCQNIAQLVSGELATMQGHIDSLNKDVSVLQRQLKETIKMANHNEQYSRRWLVRCYGIAEEKGEIKEDCTKQFIDVVNDKLKVQPPLTTSDIEAAHRIGPSRPPTEKPRPIIVRFMNRSRRYDVIKVRKDLAGSGISIADDITKKNMELLNRLKNSPTIESCWFSNGTVKAKHLITKTFKIVDLFDDINTIFA